MAFISLLFLKHPIRTSARIMASVRSASVSSLVHKEAYINGKWVKASDNAQFDVFNPANGQVVGSVPNMDVKETEDAIQAAYDAFNSWRQITAKERSQLLRAWYNKIQENSEEIASIMSSEAGKPLTESLGEVAYGNSYLEWYSEEARRVYGEVLTSSIKTKQMLHIKQPIGVAALITPWNFPLAMVTRKAGAALAAGCTCVIKPAEDTPLTALALAHCAQEAGIPPGVINVVTCEKSNAPAVGKLLCESPKVAGVTFTGSTAVGKILYRQCASGIKRISLELGGNAPFIVFGSADINKAVEGAVQSKFRNCGQTCVSANRFLIEDKVFDEFVGKLKNHIEQKMELGDPTKPSSKHVLGPLINPLQFKKVDGIVQDAVEKGATVILGGKKSPVGDLYFEPTILTDVKPNMVCYVEEVFGPVVVCMKFSKEEEALRIANETNSGLAGYFYSNDIAQVWRVAKAIDVGMCGINEGMISAAEAAFGGIKESGIGREGSHHGIEEFLYMKYLCFGNL